MEQVRFTLSEHSWQTQNSSLILRGKSIIIFIVFVNSYIMLALHPQYNVDVTKPNFTPLLPCYQQALGVYQRIGLYHGSRAYWRWHFDLLINVALRHIRVDVSQLFIIIIYKDIVLSHAKFSCIIKTVSFAKWNWTNTLSIRNYKGLTIEYFYNNCSLIDSIKNTEDVLYLKL